MACGLVLWLTPLGDFWTNTSYDYLFRFGNRPVTNAVTLILMDNAAFDQFHQTRGQPWDRALHTHPWRSASWLLENAYWEVLFYPLTSERIEELRSRGEPRPTVKVFRPEGKLTFRRAKDAHRVVLDKRSGKLGRIENVEVVTAFFTWFVENAWGFECPKRFVPWQEFVSDRDRGATGAGCGD